MSTALTLDDLDNTTRTVQIMLFVAVLGTYLFMISIII